MLEKVDGWLQKLRGSASGAQSSVGTFASSFSSLSSSLTAFGIAGLATFGLIVGFFGMAIDSAAKYQSALTMVGINANLTAAQEEVMGRAIERASWGTRSSAVDMAKALAPIAGELARIQGGALDAASAVQVLTAAQDLATSSDSTLGASVKTITNLLLVYHLKAKDAADIATTLYEAHAQLGMDVDTLAGTLQKLQPRIAGSGIDMQHLLGIVREITPTVGSGTRALNQVGNILQLLQSPTGNAAKEMEKLGISIKDASGNFIGYGPELDKLKAAYDKLSTQAEKAAFLTAMFGRQAAVGKVLVEGGSAAINANTLALLANGTASDAASKVMADANEQIALLPKTFGDISTAVGMVLLPAFNRMLTSVLPIVMAGALWTIENPELTTTILAVVAALGLLSGLTVVLGPALGVIFSSFGLLAGAIAIQVAEFGLFAYWLMSIPSVAGPVEQVFYDIVDAVQLMRQVLMSVLGGDFGGAAKLSGAFLGIGQKIVADISTALGAIGVVVINALRQVASQVVTSGPVMIGAFIAWLVPLIPRIASGLQVIGSRIIAWVQAQIPPIMTQLAKWIDAFTGWVQKMYPLLLAKLVVVGGQIINWVMTVVPQLYSTLAQWVTVFLWWVDKTTPGVLSKLWGMIGSVFSWIVGTGVPLMATAAGQLFDTLAKAAPTALQKMVALVIEYAPKIVFFLADIWRQVETALFQFVVHVAQVLPGKLLEWRNAFLLWIVGRIPGVIAALGDLASQMLNWITGTALPAIQAQVSLWGAAFISWASDAIPKLGPELDKLWTKIKAWVATNAPKIGTAFGQFATQALDWVGGVVVTLPGKLADIIGAISSWVFSNAPMISGAAVHLGEAFVNGILDFIRGSGKNDSLLDKIVKFLAGTVIPGIASVGSSVFTGFGQMGVSLAQAFANGVLSVLTGAGGNVLGLLGMVTLWFTHTFLPAMTNSGGAVIGGMVGMGASVGHALAVGLASAFVNGLNAVIGVINSVHFDIQVLGQHLRWDGVKLPPLSVPRFDKGAWELAQDQLAMVHKGEMIVPAAPAQGLRDLWGRGGGTGGETHVHHTHVYLDGREIANVVDQYTGTRLLLSGSSRARPT